MTCEQQTSAGETHQVTDRFERENRPADVKMLARELDSHRLWHSLGKDRALRNALSGRQSRSFFFSPKLRPSRPLSCGNLATRRRGHCSFDGLGAFRLSFYFGPPCSLSGRDPGASFGRHLPAWVGSVLAAIDRGKSFKCRIQSG